MTGTIVLQYIDLELFSQANTTKLYYIKYTVNQFHSKGCIGNPKVSITELLSKGWETQHVSQIISSEKGWRRKIYLAHRKQTRGGVVNNSLLLCSGWLRAAR